MQQSLPNGSFEFPGATSTTVKSLMEKNIIPIDTFVQTFLQTILSGLEHPDSQVADAWVGCLLEVIPLLPLHVLQKDVTPIIITRTLHEKPLLHRVSSCKILGALCKTYPNTMLKRDLLPVVLSLCQDLQADVRTEMACQLPLVFQTLGSNVIEQLLMPLIVDLASEEIIKVKEATFVAIVDSLPLFSSGSLKSTIIPLLKQLFDYALSYDNVLLLDVAENFGKILTGIGDLELVSDKEYFMKFYICIMERATDKQKWLLKNVQSSEQEKLPIETALIVRKHCACNYEAVVKCIYSEDNRTFLDQLHKILWILTTDPYCDIRKVIASSMRKIMESYGKHKLLLKEDYIRLLYDDMESVLEGIITQLSQALVDLARLDAFIADQLDPSNSILLKALKHCGDILESSLNWRLQCSFIEQMEVLWFIFPTDVVYKQFISIYLGNVLKIRVAPLRLAYIRTILMNAKYLQKLAYRTEVKTKILELSSSPSFYNRMLFIRTCYIIMDIYSTTYFKENLFTLAVRLSSDPVPNIRWAVCKMLPHLNNMLKFPGDEHLLELLKACIRKIESDPDREVQIMFKSIQSELLAQDDKAYPTDKKKEDEEQMLSSLTPQLTQQFPSSVMQIFDPVVATKSLPINETENVKSVSSCDEPSNNTDSGNPSTLNETKCAFTSQEFLMDTGVSLNNFKNGAIADNAIKHIDKLNHSKKVLELNRNDDEKTYQSEPKISQIKKPLHRNGIPVRMKSNIPQIQPVVKTSDMSASSVSTGFKQNVQCFYKVKDEKLKEAGLERRTGHLPRRTEKRYSLNAIEFHKRNSLGADLVDRFETLKFIDTESSTDRIKNNNESFDLNKNVTRIPSGTDLVTGNVIIQRKKKSQLPRPLSCVAVPMKNNGLEKHSSTSKLPVLRRS